jgi:preprotein translocase subunit YajC
LASEAEATSGRPRENSEGNIEALRHQTRRPLVPGKRNLTLINVQALLAMQTSSGTMGWLGFAPLIFILAIFYLLLILPQQRRQKKWQQMLNELKTGDKVVTSGGLHGTIIALRDDYLHLRVPPDNLRIEVSRASISSVITGEEPNKAAAK